MRKKLIDNKWNICKKKFRQYLYTQKNYKNIKLSFYVVLSKLSIT